MSPPKILPPDISGKDYSGVCHSEYFWEILQEYHQLRILNPVYPRNDDLRTTAARLSNLVKKTNFLSGYSMIYCIFNDNIFILNLLYDSIREIVTDKSERKKYGKAIFAICEAVSILYPDVIINDNGGDLLTSDILDEIMWVLVDNT